MRKTALLLVLAIVLVGVAALMSQDTSADPCNGKGKKNGDPGWCAKKCPPVEGCTLFECGLCGCDYYCPTGTVTVPTLDSAQHPECAASLTP